MTAINIIAEALIRIEHKIDAFIRQNSTPVQKMEFTGGICPVCKRWIEFQIDPAHYVVKRVCGCSSGKIPLVIEPPPNERENRDVRDDDDREQYPPEESDRRKGR